MIGTILKAEEWETLKGRACIRFTIECDGDISYAFAAVEALNLTIRPLLEFCHLPFIWNPISFLVKIQEKKLEGKLVPMIRTKFRDHEFWTIDWNQIRRANALRRL